MDKERIEEKLKIQIPLYTPRLGDPIFPFNEAFENSLFPIDINDAKPYQIYLKGEEFSLLSEIVEDEYQQIKKTDNKLFDTSQLLQRLINNGVIYWSECALPRFITNDEEISVGFDPTPFCSCSKINIQENDNNLYFVKYIGFVRDNEETGFFKIKEDELCESIAQEILLSRYYLRQANKVDYIHKNLDISGLY